mmetsp:Transcript_6527/g.18031  ORF Transcript_6527/g.18031 Transcript_6527/m.18031 type:complete len:86 (-) Transcript_6527:247-504(-)
MASWILAAVKPLNGLTPEKMNVTRRPKEKTSEEMLGRLLDWSKASGAAQRREPPKGSSLSPFKTLDRPKSATFGRKKKFNWQCRR